MNSGVLANGQKHKVHDQWFRFHFGKLICFHYDFFLCAILLPDLAGVRFLLRLHVARDIITSPATVRIVSHNLTSPHIQIVKPRSNNVSCGRFSNFSRSVLFILSKCQNHYIKEYVKIGEKI